MLFRSAQIKYALGISGVHSVEHAWWCAENKEKGMKGSQEDLLIVRKDQVINLCEIKYALSEYTVTGKDIENIRNKINDVRIATNTRYAIYPTLITTFGMTDNSYSGEIQSVITADALFEKQASI